MLCRAGQRRLEDRLRKRGASIRYRAKLDAGDGEAAYALGESDSIAEDSRLLTLGKIDACAEVCQHFGYYLPGSAITSQMTPLQRAVNMLYAFRDYSPVTTSLALILLPIALLPRYPNDTPTPTSNASSTRSISVFWIQMLYVSTFLAHKINTYIMYNHVGQSQVQNQESQQVWLSPCMYYP